MLHVMYSCEEPGCEEKYEHIDELKVHSSYHVYHNKIKELGRQELYLLRDKFQINIECPFSDSVVANFPQVPTKLVCEWINCNQEFLCVEQFYNHVSDHAHSLVDRCYWADCQKQMKVTKTLIRDHLKTHTLQKLFACPQCGNLFSTKIKFDDHFLRHAPIPIFHTSPESSEVQNNVSIETYNVNYQKIKLYRCNHPNCHKQFLSSSLVYEHIRCHSNKYQCDICPYIARNSSYLQSHKLYKHEQVRTFSCEICFKSFKQRGDLRAHVKRHQIVIHKCFRCEFEAHTEENLARHNRVHDNIDYQCHVCDKIFSRGNNLSRHLISQHNYSLPDGQSKFKYKLIEDGLYMLDTGDPVDIRISGETLIQ